jgi:hypothetical protein
MLLAKFVEEKSTEDRASPATERMNELESLQRIIRLRLFTGDVAD